MRLAPSKSHAHRVLIAEFLAGRTSSLVDSPVDCDDILATKRCLRALATGEATLDCNESGTTRRLLGPVVAALGLKPNWIMRGKLASRPQIDYSDLKPGVHELPGDVSSQFVSGLLFALPILKDDSEIRLTTPLASRGYVKMTLDVLKTYGIEISETTNGFTVPGNQRYQAPAQGPKIEDDWSGAAFLFALRELGNEIEFDESKLKADTLQPDLAIIIFLKHFFEMRCSCFDVDACPDSFPIMAILAATLSRDVIFTGIKRLRIKESDRVAAMEDVLNRLGVRTTVEENSFTVHGTGEPFSGGEFTSYNDHRIAMSIAVAATRAKGAVTIDNTACAAKSFPTFFEDFHKLERIK